MLTVLSTKTSVETSPVDEAERSFFSAVEKPAFILDVFWVVKIELLLLCNELPVECWVLYSLNLYYGTQFHRLDEL